MSAQQTGFLYTRRENLGTRSEGPYYFLACFDESRCYEHVRVLKRAPAWEADAALDRYVGQVCVVIGEAATDESGRVGLRYEEVAAADAILSQARRRAPSQLNELREQIIPWPFKVQQAVEWVRGGTPAPAASAPRHVSYLGRVGVSPLLKTSPPSFNVSAEGYTSSLGWMNPRLVIRSKGPNSDGYYEIDFVADGPGTSVGGMEQEAIGWAMAELHVKASPGATVDTLKGVLLFAGDYPEGVRVPLAGSWAAP
jgi:hypothetical protein